ncbi:helix-turn-helix domain-containing protein [Treponema parvum]|uniref:Helix-turn-helix domain-containing protein n=1 Tax=Treponema parvum TaxID=138851 RepID=A0A975EXS8_9SPIR|nr:helix-turn-helix domain-containing protein [Treponema parvum]QTQ10969.1 helix-turn-helix domain-containing protein [Treponema parvum]
MNKKRIGFILASIHSGSGNQVCSELIKQAVRFKTTFYIFPGGRLKATQNSEYLRNPAYRLANTKTLDGLVSWASALGGALPLQELIEFHKNIEPLPFVTISQKIEDHSCVNFDAYSGMCSLIDHFLKVHHITKIAFLRGPENHVSADDRYRAFCDTLQKAGVSVKDSPLVSDPFEWRSGKDAIIQLCEKRRLLPGKDFSALVSASDLMTLDAIEYLQNKGYSSPDDYLAAGFNDVSKTRRLRSALTTVHMPYKAMAMNSFKLILNEITDAPRAKKDVLLPAPLVVRESCGCPSLIRHALTPMSAKDAPPEAQVSKEGLIERLSELFYLDKTEGKTFLEPMINALYAKNSRLFFNLFEELLETFYRDETDMRLIYRAIGIIKISKNIDPDYIASIEKDIFIALGQAAERYQEETKSMREECNKVLDELKCELISKHSVKELSEALKKYLPRIGIHSAASVIYQKEGLSKLLSGFSKNKIFGEEEFSPDEIVPSRLVSAFSEDVFIVQPLFAGGKTIGHFICSVPFFDGALFEDLRSVLSNAFSGIFLFNELTAARKAAEEAEQAKTKFFAAVGSDLSNPLSEIKSDASRLKVLLKQKELIPDQLKSIVERLEKNIEAQQKKTDLIVELTRFQSNEIVFNNTLFHPAALFKKNAVQVLLENPHEKKEALCAASDLPVLFGDKDRIRQALLLIAENFHFKLEQCKLKKTSEGLKIVMPLSEKALTGSAADLPGVMLANQIFLMQDCEFSKNKDPCEILFYWPFFSCSPRKSSLKNFAKNVFENVPRNVPKSRGRYAAHDAMTPDAVVFAPNTAQINATQVSNKIKAAASQEEEPFEWKFREKTEDENRRIYEMFVKKDFMKRPFLCYADPEDEDLEKSNNFLSFFERKLKIAERPVLFINCPKDMEKKWNLSFTVIRIKTEDSPNTLPDMQNIKKQIVKLNPLLIVMNEINTDMIDFIRNNPSTELSPIIITPDKIEASPRIDETLGFQKLILCNLCVASSRKFGNRVKALLSGEHTLSPNTAGFVKKTLIYFNAHGCEYISRWKIAEAVHTSEDYLTRIFHRELGLSPWEYLNIYRIHIACARLRKTDESILTIAEKSGFQDQAYFCRVFKKVTGTTPGHYRKGLCDF